MEGVAGPEGDYSRRAEALPGGAEGSVVEATTSSLRGLRGP